MKGERRPRLFRVLSLGFVLAALSACGSIPTTSATDASPDTCVPESDAELCAAQNACESGPRVDSCGVERVVDCGSCGDGLGCVAGTCKTPVCTTFEYDVAPVPGMSRSGVEDSIGGVTPDGQVILYLQTPGTSGCGSFQLVIADETTPGWARTRSATSPRCSRSSVSRMHRTPTRSPPTVSRSSPRRGIANGCSRRSDRRFT